MKLQFKWAIVLVFSYFCISTSGFAAGYISFANSEEDFPPRGPNIEMPAGNCSIGPFGNIGDLGKYEGYCSKLTNGEKCLAYLKQHISQDGQVNEAYDKAKAIFCLKSTLGKLSQ